MLELFNKNQRYIMVLIMSVIWGLGLSTIFRKACSGNNCKIIKYKGPPYSEVSGQTFNYGTKECYQYRPVATKCKAV